MCLICTSRDEFSIEHMEAEIKKLSDIDRKEWAKSFKEAKSLLDKNPGESINEFIDQVNQMQFLLSRYL